MGMWFVDVVFYNIIDKSMISRWLNEKKDVMDGASLRHQHLFKKNWKSTKHGRLTYWVS